MSEAKKLIEVALPLEAINAASAREKSIRHGHPSTLHLWWARRPLAAARAVLFTSLVDDPDDQNAPQEYVEACRALPRAHYAEAQDTPRSRLFDFIEKLVQWENSNDEPTLETARRLIRMSTGDDPPPVYDPFAGGGTIPLEAQRLGLEAYASDLNPVAVLINKAMIEIPPKFAGRPPVNPQVSQDLIAREWKGAQGLAEDVRYYGQWMRDEAYRRIGHLYPKVKLPESEGGGEATVIAWLWARTIPSPNPAVQGARVPLVSSFWLSKRASNKAYVEPVIEGRTYRFEARTGAPSAPKSVDEGTKVGRGARFKCLLTGAPIEPDYVKSEGKKGSIGWRLMAIVAESSRGRRFVSPNEEHEQIALSAEPQWRPEVPLSTHPQYMSCTNYGPEVVGDLFMERQTVALDTFAELVCEAQAKVLGDMQQQEQVLGLSPSERDEYASGIATYVGLTVSRLANRQSTNSFWHTSRNTVEQVFARQALPMIWDTAEGNPFSSSSGNFIGQLEYLAKVVEASPVAAKAGRVTHEDARSADFAGVILATDPPYYDNVPYSDLADFFYPWLRRALRSVHPELFATMLSPKESELVADSTRHGSSMAAEEFFLTGMSDVFRRISTGVTHVYPITVFYAFRQSEKSEEGRWSTGWEVFLQALLDSGLTIGGSWPIRTELTGNLKKNWNALASSIVLVCRKRGDDAGVITRNELIDELREELGRGIEVLQRAMVPPVDIQQAAMGFGIGVFSRYHQVLEGAGTMSVRSALLLMNQIIDEHIAGGDADYDPYTRWAISWFSQYGFGEADFGQAETLSKARDVSVDGLVSAGFLYAKSGKVRILKREELDSKWDPVLDDRLTVWEVVHHLIKKLENDGEREAARVMSDVGSQTDAAKELSYRLFSICEQNGWAQEALGYNMLISSWPEIARLAAEAPAEKPGRELDFGE